jgi:outer membrane protein
MECKKPPCGRRFENKTYTIIWLIAIAAFCIQAQNTLTVNDAVVIALKNNYGILVARTNVDIAKVNNAAGNAGMLPSIAAIGSDNYSLNTIDQHPSAGNDVHNLNVGSNSFNAALELNWTLFDGGKMFVTKKKLNEIESLNQIQYKDKVLKTIVAVISAYYDIVRQKQELTSLNEVITYNTERVNILRTSFNAGLSPKTGFLQAQIDLNVNRENAINQQTIISAAKRTLNQVLTRDAEIIFEVQDSIPLDFTPDTSRLNESLYLKNTDLLSLQKQADIAQLSYREYSRLRYPKINLSAGYDFLRIDNTAGSMLMNRSYGPYIGAAVSVPIYQSGIISRQITTARLMLLSMQYNLEDAKQQVYTQARNTLDEFNNQHQLLLIEKENTQLAKENLDISMNRLRLGQSTSLELRQAEESYEQAHTRLINIQYNLKIAETKLKQLLAAL